MRSYLINKLYCARCGHELEINLNSKVQTKDDLPDINEPSGAFKSEMKVLINPCGVCIEENASIIEESIKQLQKYFESRKNNG